MPTLLYLIEDAERFRKSDDRNAWQHPYRAGLIGLCKLGADGAAARERLFERIDGGSVPFHASYRDLTINTLVAIGAEPQAIWQRVVAGDPKADRKRFDSILTRAAKRGPECTY